MNGWSLDFGRLIAIDPSVSADRRSGQTARLSDYQIFDEA